MDTIIRKLADGDNLNTVAQLIYETDNCVFPRFFKESKASAKEILPQMMELDTIFNKNNIYVALLDERIIGVMVILESPIKINISAYFEAFEKADSLIGTDFETVLKEYFLPLEYEPDGYFIACLCVDEDYRGRGVGGALIDGVLSELDPCRDVYLECSQDNTTARSVYEAHGFEELVKFTGFNGLPYCKMIKRVGCSLE
ncbi:MAG: GNAT family N-acetyltransferase [Clostridia bacterium]|nr:GNAT family N-acetyltransferase [Clostridia bacterium]